MSQQHTIGKHATTMAADGNVARVTYHNTVVVKFDAHTITLDSGGWRTATTKTRMNQTSNQFELGFRVYQNRREWFVRYGTFTVGFYDGMELAR